jgi:hypothetical protein
MGRRIVWLLSFPLAVCVWFAAHWLMHVVSAPDRHHSRMAEAGHQGFEPGYMCAACALLVLLLLTLMLTRPALVLGYELGQRLAARLVPRPFTWTAPPASRRHEPELFRPPILATGHGERAPPRAAIAHA